MIPKLSSSAMALALAFSHPSQSATTTGEPDLTAVRAATARFQDVKVALAEGYVRDPMDMCDTAEMMGRPANAGAMGVHFSDPICSAFRGRLTRASTAAGTHTDFRKPGILIYEPQADGSLKLVAVENLVFRLAWPRRAICSRRPSRACLTT